MASPTENIHWLGHASIKITGDKTIYIDPWKLEKADPADVILITHDHFDHLSEEDIAKIRRDDTVIVCPPDSVAKFTGDIRSARAGHALEVDGVIVEPVAAYNTNKDFHPKSNQWVGYVVTVGGIRIYVSGDTDVIPEMENLENIDVAIVPIGGTYTMTADEAAQAVNTIRPKVAVPFHYGDIVGSNADAQRFKELCRVSVEILSPEQ